MSIKDPGLRVTIIGLNYSPEHTGIAVYTSGFANALAAHCDSPKVITGYPHYPQWSIHEGYAGKRMDEVIKGVPVHRISHPVPAQPKTVNRVIMEVVFGFKAAVANWGKPEVAVLITPALFSTAILAVAAKLRRTPTVVWVQDIYSLGITETGAGGKWAARIIKRLESMVIKSGVNVVVIHERFKRYLVEELGVDPEKIAVVRNWAHAEFPENPDSEKRAKVRRERGWNSEDVVVLHAGNMGAKQGLDSVHDASVLAAQRQSTVKFVLLGDGNQRARLEAMGGNANLEFLEPLPNGEFEETIASADILLVNELPGMTEMSVPSKLTTYFSSGLPVIAATDARSTTAEELQISGAGVRVEPANPESLLMASESMSKNNVLAAKLGQAGRRFAEERLSPASATASLRQVLVRVIAKQ